MKRFFAIITLICLMVTMYSINAFAANDPSADTVIRIGAEKNNGDYVLIEDKNDFVEGWSAAIVLAEKQEEMKKNGYSRIVVDFYGDWTAGKDGEFCDDGDGFNWDAIYIPSNVKITLNLNGHTINRAITDTWQYNGEVIYIDSNADVVINDGTIKGGFSCNGAGGIHINDDARVVLNNVNVVGNRTDDDDGSGIAVYDGATLIMNGGSISNNTIDNSIHWPPEYFASAMGGAIYVEDSEVILKNVTIANNNTLDEYVNGIAISVKDSTLTLDNCTIEENGKTDPDKKYVIGISIILARNSNVNFVNTTFKNNGECVVSGNDFVAGTDLIRAHDSNIYMDSCTATGNGGKYLFTLDDVRVNINNSNFIDNKAYVLLAGFIKGQESSFTNCKFNNNDLHTWKEQSFFIDDPVTFYDCDMGDSEFNYAAAGYAKYINTNEQQGSGTMLGSGSVAIIASMFATIIAIISIIITITYNKKKKTVSDIDAK